MTKELSKKLCKLCGIEKVTKDYLDFSNPENFVKLFGLPVKVDGSEPTETVIHILNVHFHIFDDESFLCALCKYLEGYGKYKAQVIEAIREAEWVYE